jgi:hypothetical protein
MAYIASPILAPNLVYAVRTFERTRKNASSVEEEKVIVDCFVCGLGAMVCVAFV